MVCWDIAGILNSLQMNQSTASKIVNNPWQKSIASVSLASVSFKSVYSIHQSIDCINDDDSQLEK